MDFDYKEHNEILVSEAWIKRRAMESSAIGFIFGCLFMIVLAAGTLWLISG